jgi:hypothetical protein
MRKSTLRPERNSSRREIGKVGLQQRNKDKLGSNSGPMGVEDRRKDKYGSLHNQDAQGLQSNETQELRATMAQARLKQSQRKRNGRDSR